MTEIIGGIITGHNEVINTVAVMAAETLEVQDQVQDLENCIKQPVQNAETNAKFLSNQLKENQCIVETASIKENHDSR